MFRLIAISSNHQKSDDELYLFLFETAKKEKRDRSDSTLSDSSKISPPLTDNSSIDITLLQKLIERFKQDLDLIPYMRYGIHSSSNITQPLTELFAKRYNLHQHKGKFPAYQHSVFSRLIGNVHHMPTFSDSSPPTYEDQTKEKVSIDKVKQLALELISIENIENEQEKQLALDQFDARYNDFILSLEAEESHTVSSSQTKLPDWTVIFSDTSIDLIESLNPTGPLYKLLYSTLKNPISFEKLLPIVDMLTTMFNTDDLSDEALIGRTPSLFRAYNKKVLELLKTGHLSTEETTDQHGLNTYQVMYHRLATLMHRIQQTPQDFIEHVIPSIELWLSSCANEADIRESGDFFGPGPFISIRRETGAGKVFFSLAAFILGVADFLNNPQLIQEQNNALDAIGLLNCGYSSVKEYLQNLEVKTKIDSVIRSIRSGKQLSSHSLIENKKKAIDIISKLDPSIAQASIVHIHQIKNAGELKLFILNKLQDASKKFELFRENWIFIYKEADISTDSDTKKLEKAVELTKQNYLDYSNAATNFALKVMDDKIDIITSSLPQSEKNNTLKLYDDLKNKVLSTIRKQHHYPNSISNLFSFVLRLAFHHDQTYPVVKSVAARTVEHQIHTAISNQLYPQSVSTPQQESPSIKHEKLKHFEELYLSFLYLSWSIPGGGHYHWGMHESSRYRVNMTDEGPKQGLENLPDIKDPHYLHIPLSHNERSSTLN